MHCQIILELFNKNWGGIERSKSMHFALVFSLVFWGIGISKVIHGIWILLHQACNLISSHLLFRFYSTKSAELGSFAILNKVARVVEKFIIVNPTAELDFARLKFSFSSINDKATNDELSRLWNLSPATQSNLNLLNMKVENITKN